MRINAQTNMRTSRQTDKLGKADLLLTECDQILIRRVRGKASYVQVGLTEFLVAVATLRRRLGVGGMLLTGRA